MAERSRVLCTSRPEIAGAASGPGEPTEPGVSLVAQRKQVSRMSTSSTPGERPMSLEELRGALRRFASDRDWDQFHSPKNLAIALSVEAAELLEHFQWTSEADSAAIDEPTRTKVREEMADVLLYLIRLADKLNIDLPAAAVEKMRINSAKY